MPVITNKEVLFFINQHELMGRGIGYLDVHLLASARPGVTLPWTRDKMLHAVATELGLAHAETQPLKKVCRNEGDADWDFRMCSSSNPECGRRARLLFREPQLKSLQLGH